MGMFSRKETIVLRSEEQRDEYIDRLQKAHVEYDITEDHWSACDKVTYLVRVRTSDLKKVG